jgi:hypothetical protein
MFKTATLVCIGLCLVASEAIAGTNARSTAAVTRASASGLYVRAASPATVLAVAEGNVCGAAVNTGGVTRATTAVKVGGRVFLTGGGRMSISRPPLAAVTKTRTKAGPPRKAPQGLGTLLARAFGAKTP